MHAVFVTVDVHPEFLGEFEAAIAVNREATLAEPGCHRFDLLRSSVDRARFHFYELYTDAAAFEVDHRAAPHYADWREVASRVVARQEIVRADVVAS